MTDYAELAKELRVRTNEDYCNRCVYRQGFGKCKVEGVCAERLFLQAADAIEELSALVRSLKFFADNIAKLPDCNTCLKKGACEFMPRYGEYCRINCPAWLGEPPDLNYKSPDLNHNINFNAEPKEEKR